MYSMYKKLDLLPNNQNFKRELHLQVIDKRSLSTLSLHALLLELITMVNPLYVVYALSAIAGVEACKRTCSASNDAGTTCSYSCTHVCSSISAKQARDTFLAALQSGGNSCSAVGTSGVSCRKTAKFGSCYDHHWSCGSGC
ncbi:hypothetical protein Forpe1208_v004359 [Fusarium oxysporum f. sp. rapae]|uniref:Uncharacterized protein n=1 Tax=Fusarium oxysporum f. sp. rapae TaxID=485398 RepID=A0A8J5PG62_FUSOX|nr:hypothetical protein Forpe1208_v004359 [Fusarium oxysporum f. sp. rapae]